MKSQHSWGGFPPISVTGAMLNAMPKDNGQAYCTACFSGEYPIQIEEKQLKERNER